MDIFEILKAAVESGASDIHLTIGRPPMVRQRGELDPLPGFDALTQDTAKELIYGILYSEHRLAFEANKELDCSLALPGVGRFRVNVFEQKDGVCAVLRVIPSQIPQWNEIGISQPVLELTKHKNGLVLVTGPTGSGKTTTIACLLQMINETRKEHILTVEDPIEFTYASAKAVISQRELGTHTKSFANALKGALREDPDVILVGELRDLETIQLALTMAETGHLVFGTLHTTDAPHTVDRMIDVFPAYQQPQIRMQIGSVLRGVVCQQLLPRRGGGRVAAREVLIVTNAVANLIREGKTHQLYSAIDVGTKFGMISLDKALQELVDRRQVSHEDALKKANNPGSIVAASGPGTGPVGSGPRSGPAPTTRPLNR